MSSVLGIVACSPVAQKWIGRRCWRVRSTDQIADLCVSAAAVLVTAYVGGFGRHQRWCWQPGVVCWSAVVEQRIPNV